MAKIFEGKLQAEGMKFALVEAGSMISSANIWLAGPWAPRNRNGAKEEDVVVFKVPGAFEIPLVAKQLALKKKYDAIIRLGAVIRGSTPHFDYVSAEMSKGIANASLEPGSRCLLGR